MRTRVLSALIGAPLVIGIILWPGGTLPFPGWPLALLVLLLIFKGLREFYNGCREMGLVPRDYFGWAAGFLFLLIATPLVPRDDPRVLQGALTILVLLSLVQETIRPDRSPLRSLGPTWLGALYVGWLMPFILRLRLEGGMERQRLGWILPQEWMVEMGEGAWLLLFTALVTSSVDTGAYFAGKTLGKRKLAPLLSPGKTWEGAIGGFMAALLVATLAAAWLQLPFPLAITAGALIGILAQTGDLAKSAIKREVGIKDFGTLIPGHGGVLDRFDSLMFTAPAVYWLVAFWRL